MGCNRRLLRWFMAALVIPAILSSPLFAFAGGLTPEPLGAEAFLSGVTPAGEAFVIKEYIDYYRAKKLETNHGYGLNHTVSLKTEGYALDKLQVIDFTTRFLYISPLKISVVGLDGYLLGHAYIPVVSSGIKLDLPTDQSDHHTGVGDVIVGPGVWWTYKHWIAEAHVDYEIEARNRPQGINSWLTILYKF